MALNDTQLERYSRHILLKEIGGPGQRRLLDARVLLVGAGALASPCLLYLAAAGVGTIGIVDDDIVSLSNLQRQIAYGMEDLGAPKVERAARAAARINPDVKIIQHPFRLTQENARDLVAQYDLVADGCDNFETRFIVNDACYFERVTLISAAVGRFDGQLATFKSHLADENGVPLPNYRDLVTEMPEPGSIPTCEETGVIGALTGVIGSLQALEVIKELTGAGESLAGKLLIYDALETRFRTIRLRHDPANPLTGRPPLSMGR